MKTSDQKKDSPGLSEAIKPNNGWRSEIRAQRQQTTPTRNWGQSPAAGGLCEGQAMQLALWVVGVCAPSSPPLPHCAQVRALGS